MSTATDLLASPTSHANNYSNGSRLCQSSLPSHALSTGVVVGVTAASPTVRMDETALDALWQSTRPAAQSLSSPIAASHRSQRALESGHVFVRHSLSGRSVVSERVVLFVVSGVLYACKHARQQSRYKQPFLAMPLSSADQQHPVRIYMGKQTAALRLVPNDIVPERRCFAIRLADSEVELEAPGSGDVRYWLRSLYELLTRTHSLAISHSLLFLPPHTASCDDVERAERRLRQLRMDGQRARRREEADRRMDGQQRMAQERTKEERRRTEELEQRRQRWLAVQYEAECRVASSGSGDAVLSPSRVLLEERGRLDGDRRMHEAFQREAELEVERRRLLAAQPPHTPALASEYAKHNQRCTALQTHTRAPLLAHSAQANSSRGADGVNVRRRLGESKSFPNLIAAVSSTSPSSMWSSPASSSLSPSSSVVAPPASATRSLSIPATRSASPEQPRLPSHMPNSQSHSPSPSSLQASVMRDSPRSSPAALPQPLQAANSPSTAATSGQCATFTSSTSSLSSTSASPSSFSSHSVLAPSSNSTPAVSSSANSPLASLAPSSAAFPLFRSVDAPSSSVSPFEPSSPLSSLPYSSSLYSPTACLPVTAVYCVRTPSVGLEQQTALSAALSSLSALSVPSSVPGRAKSAAAVPDAPSSSFRFHCAIELPDLSTAAPTYCPPPSSSPLSTAAGGTHFHFHLHTALHSPSGASSKAADMATSWPLLSPPPPPYSSD